MSQALPGIGDIKGVIYGIPKPCAAMEIYGEHSEEVELLRGFRDEVLSQSPVGQEIIELYYQWSPVMIEMIE